MIELTPGERLHVHLHLYYPGVKMKHVRLSENTGFLEVVPLGQIDIRGASYGPKDNPLRLWNELHGHFSQHVKVMKRKNGHPTRILWNGMVFQLDQNFTYTRDRRPRRIRERKQQKGVK